MKFLFFTDQHLRSQSDRPKWRTDDHYKVQFDELAEVVSIAKSAQVDMILGGGDLIHYPKISHGLVSDVINWCKTLPCAFYTVVGNHCCYGYRTDDLKSSGLGVLFESGMIANLGAADLVWEEHKVVIRGIHAFLNPRAGNYMFDPKYDGYYKIIVSHNFIIPEPVPFDYVLPSDVKTNANVVLLGHYHKAFDHMEGSTRFINPGSLSRWSINETHQPQVFIIDTATNTVSGIPLRTARPAAEIFDFAAASEMREQEMNLQHFVESLESTSFENVDVEQVLVKEGKAQQVPQSIVDLALAKVQQAKVELK